MRAFIVLLLVCLAQPCSAQDLTEESLNDWIEYIHPDSDERCYLDIPWRQSFRIGLKDAQVEGKPVLLWAMNGNPLGCT